MIKNYFANKDANWIERLNTLGFDKVHFPIVIIDRVDIEVVIDLHRFAIDSDYYAHEFPSDMEFIDSSGQVWTWQYDPSNNTNLPGERKKVLTFDEIKKIVFKYFKDTSIQTEIAELIDISDTISKLLQSISGKT